MKEKLSVALVLAQVTIKLIDGYMYNEEAIPGNMTSKQWHEALESIKRAVELILEGCERELTVEEEKEVANGKLNLAIHFDFSICDL